jgi:hypothetical protein
MHFALCAIACFPPLDSLGVSAEEGAGIRRISLRLMPPCIRIAPFRVAYSPVLLGTDGGSRVLVSTLTSRGSNSPMTSKPSQQSAPPIGNLKRSFENAVRDIYHVGLTGKASQYRRPIVQRAGSSVPESSLGAEKRALSDAAAALARLWKVAPHSVR